MNRKPKPSQRQDPAGNPRKYPYIVRHLSRLIDVSTEGSRLRFANLTPKDEAKAFIKQLPYLVEYGVISALAKNKPELFEKAPSHRFTNATYIDVAAETGENLPPYYDRQELSYHLDFDFSELAVPPSGPPVDAVPMTDVEQWMQSKGLFDSKEGEDPHYAERAFIQNVFVPSFGLDALQHVTPQAPVGPYFVDFLVCSPFGNCYVEIDGRTHDPRVSSEEEFQRETYRQNFIIRQGRPLFRFTARQVLKSPGEVATQLRECINFVHQQVLFEVDPETSVEVRKPHPDLSSLISLCRWFRPLQLAFLRVMVSEEPGQECRIRVPEHLGDIAELAARDLSHLGAVLFKLFSTKWEGKTKLTIVRTGSPSDAVRLYQSARSDGPDRSMLLDIFEVEVTNESNADDAVIDLEVYGTLGAEKIENETTVIGKEIGEAPTINALLRSFITRKRRARFRLKRAPKTIVDYFARRLLRVPSLYHNRQGSITEERQFEIVARVLKGSDTFGIMPTGRGKSLAFQLPGLVLPGSAIVISPLRALMRDQVSDLTCLRGVNGVAAITFDMPPAERERTIGRFLTGELRLLYVSPERLQEIKFSTRLAEAAKHIQISFIAIDEAHCVSEWGHDFRLSYLQISHFMDHLEQAQGRRTNLLALTATASPAVRGDVCRILRWKNLDVINGGVVAAERNVDRPELSISVHEITGQRYPDDRQEALQFVLTSAIPRALSKYMQSWELFVSGANESKQAGVVFCVYRAPHGQTSWHDGIGLCETTWLNNVSLLKTPSASMVHRLQRNARHVSRKVETAIR